MNKMQCVDSDSYFHQTLSRGSALENIDNIKFVENAL